MHASALHQSSLNRRVDSHFVSGSCNLKVRELKIVIIKQQFKWISDIRRVYLDLAAYKPKFIKSKILVTLERMTYYYHGRGNTETSHKIYQHFLYEIFFFCSL